MTSIKRFLEWSGDSPDLTPEEEAELIRLGLVKPPAWVEWHLMKPDSRWVFDRNPIWATIVIKVPSEGIEDEYVIYAQTVEEDEPVIRRDIEAFVSGELSREDYQARAWSRAPSAAQVTLTRWAGHYDAFRSIGLRVTQIQWLHNAATDDWQRIWTDAR